MMGGKLAWNAVPIMTEMFGIVDVELFIRSLVEIRDHQAKKK